MKIIKYIIVFYTALSTVVMAQENQVLYCSDIDGNGFIPNEKGDKYERTGYAPLKYTISISSDNSSIQVKEVNAEETLYMSCNNTYSVILPELITCSRSLTTFNFNTKTLHYTNSFMGGWLQGVNDSILVSYGTCAKF
jgi:hypothetical protein